MAGELVAVAAHPNPQQGWPLTTGTALRVDEDAVRSAIASQRMFNLMHYDSGIKLDFIMRKDSEYRQLEFSRRRQATIDGIPLWVVSREDLILSKLAWSRDSGSELQRRDASALLNESVDRAYLEK